MMSYHSDLEYAKVYNRKFSPSSPFYTYILNIMQFKPIIVFLLVLTLLICLSIDTTIFLLYDKITVHFVAVFLYEFKR